MLDLLKTRRSIRNYQSRDIEKEKINILKEAVLRSPSSKNVNPWEFIFINDKNLIKKLKNCKPQGTKPLISAPLAIIIYGDTTKTDVWIEDCSIASIILQLTAQSLKLGSCWIQIRNRNYSDSISSSNFIKNLLNIPDRYEILSIISVGYPAEQKQPKKMEHLKFEKIKTNNF